MKRHGHDCKVCGEYKTNEKFSGKGHAAHICKTCAVLPPEVRELAQEQLEIWAISAMKEMAIDAKKIQNKTMHDQDP